MDMKQHKYELCVLEGMQEGSRQPLQMARANSVGNSFDCDMYLHDMSETSHQIEILAGKLSMSATLISGEAVLDNKPMKPGAKYKLPLSVPIRIGENLVCVESVYVDTQSLTSKGDKTGATVNSDSLVRANDQDTQHTMNEQGYAGADGAGDVIVDPRMMSRLLRPKFLMLIVGIGLVGSGVAALQTAPKTLAMAKNIVTLEEHVQANVVGDVSVMPTDEGAYMVKGWLSSREEERKLNQALLQRSEEVIVKTNVVADIEASVKDVFRIHGLQAEISTLKPGKLVVRTQTADLAALARAENSAKSDVHGLEELSVVNTKPVTETVNIPKPVRQNDVDQDIQLLVVGEPSYVVASNQARYFLGSKLPTGHRIESIFKDKVVLSKNGVTTELAM